MNSIIQVVHTGNVNLPKLASEFAACSDIVAATEPIIVGQRVADSDYYTSIDYIEYGTGLFMTTHYSDDGKNSGLEEFFIDIRPRSSISKYNLVMANAPGTGDRDYAGEYKLRFKYIFQPDDLYPAHYGDRPLGMMLKINRQKIYQKGDRIGQIRTAVRHPTNIVFVDKLPETVRGTGGFGSSGK